ncbi:uncharacterized protein LOC117123861 [Anneissia japonica]|uniref:uncharacterized protein LOC117123861 n=1 Tax=Anneissia japonica TaxID=1529436 RepID=UPI0014259079|nr:uncharacterized protein LOC117123861 [Anneissia japonica]
MLTQTLSCAVCRRLIKHQSCPNCDVPQYRLLTEVKIMAPGPTNTTPRQSGNQEVSGLVIHQKVNERGERSTRDHDVKKEVKVKTSIGEPDKSSEKVIQSVDKELTFADDENNKQIIEIDQNNKFVSTKKQTKKKVSKQSTIPSQKRMKKSIAISYSPDGGYEERKFVASTVKQFKENHLGEDIWFDKDEKNTDSPAWLSQRLESIERCRAAVCFLSHSYFQCPVSKYEARCLLERQHSEKAPKIFTVILDHVEIPKQYSELLVNCISLIESYANLSLAEKSSHVIGRFMEDLENCASIFAPHVPPTPEMDLTEDYKQKKLCQWTGNDVQSWLYNLGVREFFQQSFAEQAVDGFLLMSLMESDLTKYLAIDSRAVRKKILQQIFLILEKEQRLPGNWHLRLRTQRCRADAVYLVYDPADVRLAQNLKQDLQRKNLQVLTHEKLGQSKEEFLHINGPLMAQAKNIIVLLTEASISSPFVFHEVLFADWLGKTLVTVMLKNVWSKMRPSLKAVLGECPAIDFETKMYSDGMDILQHHIKPLRKVPGVVLEQSYLNRMSDGLKPLQILAASTNGGWSSGDLEPKVFISYQWDMQNKVQEIKKVLEANGIPCWSDITPTMTRGSSSVSSRSSTISSLTSSSESLQGHIQRNMKAASIVLCCVTPRYLQSDNCLKDLVLADQLQKHIIPVLLRFVAWPPDTGPSQVKKTLARTNHVDLSNDKLYKQNFHSLLDRVRRQLAQKT